MSKDLQEYYRRNPLMVSSPFGGVDGVNHELAREVFDRLGIALAGRRILDTGCGRGYMGDYVRELGGTYVGTDFVASRAGFTLALADAAALPFPNGTFDTVFCIDAFEHIPEPEQATREFRRVLRPGGFVFLSAPNYSNVAGLVKKVCEGAGWYERNTWAPFRNWQPQELEHPLTGTAIRRVFGAAGFTRFTRIGHPVEVGIGLFPWVEHAKMPEAIKFRLQRVFAAAGPSIVSVWPAASLHGFWRIEV
ncbi:MAG: methyltransferase domain-containing protein [Candidatus Hydrogenedentes bacterium]|nr:methyltransferase domain-containing protein [Candidatus Hydrogenedentota bacterium]